MTSTNSVDPKWNQYYQEGQAPWDTGFPSRELIRILDAGLITGRTALELGCGTGTNAILLARRNFQVTAIDGAPLAISRARQTAESQQVNVRWIEADVCTPPDLGSTFDFVFDRGCFHCVRTVNLSGYLETIMRYTRPGSQFLVLTGNAHETGEGGPPRLTKAELRGDLEPRFEIVDLHSFRFDNPDGSPGPLAWSCLMTRRE